MSSLLLAGLLATASAAPDAPSAGALEPTVARPGDFEGASPITANPEASAQLAATERVPIYFLTRGSVAVPARGRGQVFNSGVGLGMALGEHDAHLLGMRVIWIPDPPRNPLTGDDPEVNNG